MTPGGTSYNQPMHRQKARLRNLRFYLADTWQARRQSHPPRSASDSASRSYYSAYARRPWFYRFN